MRQFAVKIQRCLNLGIIYQYEGFVSSGYEKMLVDVIRGVFGVILGDNQITLEIGPQFPRPKRGARKERQVPKLTRAKRESGNERNINKLPGAKKEAEKKR